MNNKLLNKLLVFGFIIMATSSCERDDICAETTPTTPHLIIRFYDINNPEEFKQVRQLSIRGFDANDMEIEQEILAPVNTDSIVLPLRFDGEGIPTTSRFILEKDRDFFLDTNPATVSNIDMIKVNYTPEFVYVSRACGYKSIFTNTSITIVSDSENWIFSSEVINTTIENENQAHIILRH
ncbi:MAG: DUF6452 family protein [Gelidibacter sp.]